MKCEEEKLKMDYYWTHGLFNYFNDAFTKVAKVSTLQQARIPHIILVCELLGGFHLLWIEDYPG